MPQYNYPAVLSWPDLLENAPDYRGNAYYPSGHQDFFCDIFSDRVLALMAA